MFWSRVSQSLGLRLSLLLALVLAAYGSITAFLSARNLSVQLLEEATLGTLRLVDTIKRSTRHDMLNTRCEDVHQTIQHIGEQEGIEHVRIFNKDGKIMYSSAIDEVSRVVDRNAEACYHCHQAEQPLTRLEQPQRSRIFAGKNGHRVLSSIDVIYNEPGCWTAACHHHPESQSVLGVLDLGVSLEDVDERVATATTGALVYGLVSTLMVCLLAGLFIHRTVNRPVTKLLRGIRRVSEGDLDSPICIDSSDEIGHLARSFNQMTEDLGKARAEIENWTLKLEQEIKEKTRDLSIAQQKVLRSEKLSSLGILAAGVAHELNSPLTGILTFAHLLMQKMPKDSQDREDLQLIVNETNRCAVIIRQLLDFSRENAPSKQPRNVNQVIDQAINLVRRQALFHDVKIECHLHESLQLVELDANQMKQVFLNLLVNSAEAMQGGGTIHICSGLTDSAPERVFVAFKDTGSGIPKTIIDKIFDPFFTSKAVGEGTGLGLALSYGIVKRHGGTIEVTSIPGEETTFTITLPTLTQEAVTP